MVSAIPFYSKGSSNSVETNPNLSDGEFPSNSSVSPQRKSSRRQWSVQEEPRALLRRLRSQLAEDGCAESQYLMAKALFECKDVLNAEAKGTKFTSIELQVAAQMMSASHGSRYEDNCKQAVFWLTQSSLQGSRIATSDLQECFTSGLGICEENYEDVKKCLELDQQEKLAQVAGKQLFGSLCKGNEFVSLRKLNKKIYSIITSLDDTIEDSNDQEDENKDLDKTDIENSLEERYGSKRLSENMLVEAAKKFILGDIPSIHIKYDYNEYNSLLRNIHNTILSFLNRICKPFSKGLSLPFISILSLFLCGLMFIHNDYAAVIMCYMLWLFAFASMLYSASSVMIQQFNIKIFNIWSVVFKKFSPEIDIKMATHRFKRKHLKLYFIYLASIFIYMCIFPLINKKFSSFIFPPLLFTSLIMFATLFRSNFLYNFLSSCLYVFAHYCHGHVYVQEFLIANVPFIEPFVLNESIPLLGRLNLHFNVGSIIHCLWFVSFVLVSFTLGLSGVLYHFLCVTWFHLLLLVSQGGTDLLTSISFAVWLFVFLIPYSWYMLSAIFPVILIDICLLINGAGYETSVAISLCLMFIFLVGSKKCSRFITLLKSFITLLSLAFLISQQLSTPHVISSLKWEQYQNSCLPSKEAIAALTVKNCRPLQGTMVQWQAVVKQVEVESVSNWVNDIVSLFPKAAQSYLKCFIGTQPNTCNRELFMTDFEHQQCLLVQDIKGSECSLDSYDYYKFKIIVSMDSTFWKFQKTSDIILIGGNEFENVAFGLSLHDRISFIGTLAYGIGTSVPEIQLAAISCADCVTQSLHSKTPPAFNLDLLFASLRNAFNFFFSPTFST